MKRSLAIIISLIFVISVPLIFSTCGGSGGGTTTPPTGGYTATEDLGGGVKATINSPVPVTCNTSPAAGTYHDGWSKVPVMEITGALGAGQVMTLTYESTGGFEAEDEIAYVDGDGNWMPFDSNIKQVGDTISASVDQCNTVFGAGPVYTLEVTVNYDPSASVDEDHPIYVGAFCVNWTDPEPYESEPITASGGSYTFALPSEDYVLFIFLDENNDGEPDIGEAYQYYDGSENEAGATAITVDSDQSVTANLDDTYTYPATGSVSVAFPSGQTLSNDFTATGTYSGDVNSIEVQIDGNPEGSAVLNGPAETWSYDVSVSGLAETAHTITVNAYYNSTLLDSDDSSFTYSSTPVNNDPALSQGGVSPTSGDTSTAFTYSVDYYDIDGDAPSTIQVYIDGSPSSMTLSSGTASNGTYTLSGVTLAAGSHTYYFSCEDGNGGSDRLPETGTYSGPDVTSIPVNNDPALWQGVVSPTSGDTSTTFTYSVHYYDIDEDPPATIQVYIDAGTLDAQVFSMTFANVGGTETVWNGTYTKSGVTLAAGSHTSAFYCEDGNGGSHAIAGTGGPTVTSIPINNDPALSQGGVSPSSGGTSTTFTYSVDYYDIDGDAPSTIQVYIDGSPSSMTLSSGTASNGTYTLSGVTLAAGSHTYYFSCEDGNGGSDRLPETGTYSGPDVTGLPTQVTLTFTFIDYFSKAPLPGVEWYDYEDNQILTSGADGTMSISGDSPLRMRGYFVNAPVGYQFEDVYYIDTYLTEDMSRTFPIQPDEANMPDVVDISGTLNAKGGGTILNGSIEIYTGDGMQVGGGYATGTGGYEGGVMSTGNLYFIVTDYGTGEIYYAVINVSASGTYDVSPPAVPDVTLSGSAPAGTEVGAYLLLGEEFAELGSQEVQAGTFSIDIPLQGSDVVRLDCFFEDADGNDWTYYDPNEYTASDSGIDYSTVFSGLSVPDTWTSNLAWDDVNAILTWDSADDVSLDVSCYEIEFVSTDLEVVLNAIIEDTGVGNQIETPLGSGDLFMANILPVYSEGYIEGFMQAQMAEGVQIWCDNIADRLQTDNDLNFVYFDDSDALPNNSVSSVVIDDQINGMVLVGTNGGGVSFSDDLVTWDQLTGLTSNSVRDIAVDPSSNGYWIGSYGGVDFVDADTGAVLGSLTTSNSDLVSDNVTCVAVDYYNVGLWIGTNSGVSFFDYSTTDITNYTNANTSGGLADDWVHDIEVDQYGVVWFCTDGGVSYFDGADWTTYTTADGLAYDGVEGMAFDDKGGIWFATRMGVSYLDYTGSFTTYRTQDGLWNNYVGCVTVESDGDEEGGVWFGTGYNASTGGVSYYDDHYGFVSFGSDNGLASGYVMSIAIDPDGGLWIGMYGGGVCYLP